jgi:hypothetical protein
MKDIKKLVKLSIKLKKLQIDYELLLMKVFKSYRGKYLKDKIDSPKIIYSITHIPALKNDWSNCLEIVNSFICEDEISCWYKLDEKQDYNNYNDLIKLTESEIISEEEYNSIRAEIVHMIQRDRVDKFNKEMEKLK